MSDEASPAEVFEVDYAARRAVTDEIGGDRALLCYQCGACVGDCPSARFSPGFNPREIVLATLLGDIDTLVCADSPIWRCSTCYTCYDRCPQEVRPVDVIIVLKNLARERGLAPAVIPKVTETVLTTGRSVVVTPAVQRQRKKLGLPPLEPIDAADLQRLIEPDDGGAR